jgi:hypothetical protein
MTAFAGLALATLALFLLASLRASAPHYVPGALVASVGFVIISPYSYLAGAMAPGFGGKQHPPLPASLMALATWVEFCRVTRWLAFRSLRASKAPSRFWEPPPLSPLWLLPSSSCFSVAL